LRGHGAVARIARAAFNWSMAGFLVISLVPVLR
jgi:hypothetical protein